MFFQSGAFYIILSTLFLTAMGICVKSVPGIPFAEVVFFRSGVSLLLSVLALKKENIPILGHNRVRLVIRGITGTLALVCYFMTLQKLPFSLSVTLQYLSPIFTILVSAFLLKEVPTILQWIMVSIAFYAVTLVYDIRLESFSTFAVFGILGALFAALSYANIRSLTNVEHPMVIVFYFAAIAVLAILPFTIWSWKMPTPREWMILLAMGSLAQVAQYCITVAYQKSKAPEIANYTYLNVVWAVLVGEFLFGENHTAKSLVGILMIICCALLANIDGAKVLSRLRQSN